MAQQNQPDNQTGSGILAAYLSHVNALKRYVGRIVGIQNDVDDVVQEAFLRAHKAESDRQIEQPKSYLFRVAKHVALNQIRQKINRPTDYLEDNEQASALVSEWSLEDELMAEQKLAIHCAAVASLPPKCRKVYLMRKVYAMSYKEIASALEISVSTVETHLEKGFDRCEAYIAEHLDEPNGRRKKQKQAGGSRI